MDTPGRAGEPRLRAAIALFLALAGGLAPGRILAAPEAAPPSGRVLTLDEAVKTAEAQQPTARQAAAQTEAARAKVLQARAPLLPQVTGTAAYTRQTGNYAPRPGAVPSSLAASSSNSLTTYNYFSFGVTATQLLYDFGQSAGKWRAAQAAAESQAHTERATRLGVVLAVRTAYFSARAQKALVQVAREQLENQERHLAQVEGFVKVGTKPEIDLAQARADRANARVSLINAENNYDLARAQLNQAMGVEGPTSYDVTDEALPAIAGEGAGVDPLVAEALRARPEFAALEQQVRAQEQTLRSARGTYWPSLGLSTALTDAGHKIDAMAWNWNATFTLSWSLFSGLQTRGLEREASATLVSLRAQRDALRLQVRVEVEQARLGVRAARAALGAAEESLENSRLRLRLAEGRYQTGVGNIIELGDAQVALTSSAAQKVQAEFSLASARAQLLKALGRR
jgi:outer membrane protein